MESNRIEYKRDKRELNDRLERAVVSFLNYAGGGEIVVGMNDDAPTIIRKLGMSEQEKNLEPTEQFIESLDYRQITKYDFKRIKALPRIGIDIS